MSGRPVIAMDYQFSQTKFHCELSDNTTRVSDVHCCEGGHQNIMSSVVVQKGIVINPGQVRDSQDSSISSGYKEITLKR